jgi:AraC-like DNA-binding protein
MKLLPRRPNRETIVPDGQASFSCRRFRLRAFAFEWHYHPEIELTLIVQGRGLRFVGDSIAPYESGDLLLIGPDLPHTWHSSDDDGGVESIVIHFPRRLLGEAFERMPEFRLVRKLLDNAGRAFHITGDARDRVDALMKQAAAAKPASLSQLMALIESLKVISEHPACALAVSTSHRPAGGMDSAATRKLQRVIERIHSTVADGMDAALTQAAMARFAGMSPPAFSRFFHLRMGRPYARYLNEWREGLACRQLVETDQDITDIAFACGFGNLSNFNRRFKQIKAMTPRQFRRLGSPVGGFN